MNSRQEVRKNWIKTFPLTTNQIPWLFPDFSLSTKFPDFSLFSMLLSTLAGFGLVASHPPNKWKACG